MNKSTKFFNVVKNKVFIRKKKFIEYLNLLGVYLYYPDGKNWILVKVDKNIIEEISISHLKQMFFQTIDMDNFPFRDKVVDKVLNSINSLFSKGLLETLPVINPVFIKDRKDTAFLFFKNTFLLVRKDSVRSLPYKELPGKIWGSQIIDRVFPLQNEPATKQQSEFETFISRVSGDDPKRKKSLESIIGYLMHGYKDPSNPKAVIFYDLPNDDNNNPDGRRGKGIIVLSLKMFLKITKEDGKLFSAMSNFAFQQVDLNTMILFFDDVPREFDMIKLFSVVSEGIQIEKKQQPKFTLSYSDSPKVVITSNYLTKGVGESYQGRRIEFGLSPYFSTKWTPKHEFKHLLFDEWDKEEWSRFNIYMVNNLMRYLQTGIITCKNSNSPKQRLATETSSHFSTFCNKNISIGEEFNTKELYEQFLSLFQEKEGFSKTSQHLFTKWLKLFAKYNNLEIKERKSNGKKLLVFSK